MITVKLIAIGEEVGVVLPEQALQKLGVRVGDWLRLDDRAAGIHLTRCDPDFVTQMKLAERVMAEHGSVLRRLAGE